MYLTAQHYARLREGAGEFRGGPAWLLRNAAFFSLSAKGFDVKIQIRRNPNGTYKVDSRFSTSEIGFGEDLEKLLAAGRQVNSITKQTKRALQATLKEMSNECTRLSPTQLAKCKELVTEFKWHALGPLDPKDFGPLGFTVSDGPNFEWVINNTEKAGRLEVDAMPNYEVQVYYSHKYLLPLVKKLRTYLRSKGFTVSTKIDKR